MNVTVTAQGMSLPIGFKDEAEGYVDRLEKTAPADATFSVVLKGRDNPSRGKDAGYKVTARVVGKGVDETASYEGRTPTAALDKAIDVLARQLRQAKEKRTASQAMPMNEFADNLSDDSAARL